MQRYFRLLVAVGLLAAIWAAWPRASGEPELLPWDISDADYAAWEREQYRLIRGGYKSCP